MSRRVVFAYPDDFNPRWQPRVPELACAANAVSLMMPYVEPYVVKSVRSTLPDLPADMQERTKNFLRQETEHHKQHRRFNDLLIAAEPGLLRNERWMRSTYDWLHRSRSDAFNVAFAAGFETVAFSAARWTEARLGSLLDGADDVPATLFLWHLAEEVEHKADAWDAYHAVHGSRLTYVMAMITSMLLLAWFAVINTSYLLFRQGRFFKPIAHWRMLKWSVSFLFELLPAMAVSALPGHHPSSLVDPTFYQLWLREYDDESGTIPVWNRG